MEDEKVVVTSGVVDIADFDTVSSSTEGSAMEVRNPRTNEVLRHADGRPFTITLRGKDSEQYRELARKQQDRRIQANMRTRMPVLSSTIEKDDIELNVVATVSWDILLGGKAPKNDPKQYRDAYTKYVWLKEQVDEFLGVRANFIKA
jgi:hypothetical protein